MNILLIDFESTGLDTSKDRIIEIGAQLTTDRWEPLGSLSVLINGPDMPKLSEEIQVLTGIKQAELDKSGIFIEEAMVKLFEPFVGEDVQYVVAYNKAFDEPLFKSEMNRHQLSSRPNISRILENPWLCAMVDLERNYQYKHWKLMHLALEYGLTVNPKELHRAVNDVELMRRILAESGVTPDAMFNFQKVPWVVVRALIPVPWEDGGKGRDLAKAAGYSWETPKGMDNKYDKAWVKRVKQTQLYDEIKKSPFKVRQIV